VNKNVDPATQWVILILLSVLAGTCLLIAVAFIRRWQQIRYRRYVHSLQRQYRPVLAKVLSGAYSSSDVETLRQLPIPELEILLEPVFSKRVLPDRCMRFLGRLCAELGLIALWQRRANSGYSASRELTPDRGARGAGMRYALRAKSLRNLGVLRHHPSWRLLVNALDNRDPKSSLWPCGPWRGWERRRVFPCCGTGSMRWSKAKLHPRQCRDCDPP